MVHASQRQLTNIYLGGVLGQKFGEKWRLAVSSPAEAIQAINVNTRGKLIEYLGLEGKSSYYQIALDRKDQFIEASELRNRSGSCDIYILPAIQGQSSGWGKILIGAVLIAAVVVSQQYELLGYTAGVNGAAGTTAAWATTTYGIVAAVGTSLLLGGISQLLAPHKNQQGELNSNSFQGTIAAAQQGGPVPVCYGKALISPSPISIWFTAVDWNTTANAYVGTLQAVNLPGGGTEYISVAPSPVVAGE
jgi:predicted phage tail protein